SDMRCKDPPHEPVDRSPEGRSPKGGIPEDVHAKTAGRGRKGGQQGPPPGGTFPGPHRPRRGAFPRLLPGGHECHLRGHRCRSDTDPREEPGRLPEFATGCRLAVALATLEG